MSSMQKRHLVSAALVVLILIAGVAFWAFQRGVITYKDGGIRFSKAALLHPMPSLDREVQFPADFTEEAQEIYLANVARVTEAIRENAANVDAWFDLAIYYRMLGDHEGAIEIWEYVGQTYADQGISLHNLGEYYFHNEKDYEKAEGYYRKSIDINPTLESNYTDLYEMYRYVYKQDTNAAIDILLEGANSMGGVSAIQMQILLGRHYRDVVKDNVNARSYLVSARDAALERGDRSIADTLTAEINAL